MAPVNVLVIGSGARSIAYCRFLSENPQMAKPAAIVDTTIEKAKLLNEYFSLNARVLDDYDKIVRDSGIDAVMISTPDYAHVAPAVAALKAGKHVYLEKPLATSLADCDQILAAACDSRSICYLGFNLRHNPVYEKVHDVVASGILGKITTIEANEWYYGGKTYFRRWNRFRKFGGGIWMTKACHDFDYITWIANGTPVSVYATSSLSHYKMLAGAGPRCRDCKFKGTCPDYYDINKPLQDWFDETWRQVQLKMDQSGPLSPDICLFNSEKDTFDNGIAVINYDNDVRATYTVNVLGARTTRQIRIVGVAGMLEADIDARFVRITERHTGKESVYEMNEKNLDLHGGADNKILTDFFSICSTGGTPRTGLADGRLAVKISLAVTKSDDSKAIVDFNSLPK